MERKYQYNLNTITEAQMVDIEMTAEQAQFLIDYRNKFKLLEGEDCALVNLEELWSALDEPYGRYDRWLDAVATPTLERLNTQICVSIQKRPGRGQPKKIRSIDTESAKALTMMANNEAGDIARRYFITVEKLFKKICAYNSIRINVEQHGKNVSHAGFKTGDKWKGIYDKKRFNYLLSTICGKRNLFETDLYETQLVAADIERLMNKGKTNSQIFDNLI
jgi:phage anti-repressor protein